MTTCYSEYEEAIPKEQDNSRLMEFDKFGKFWEIEMILDMKKKEKLKNAFIPRGMTIQVG